METKTEALKSFIKKGACLLFVAVMLFSSSVFTLRAGAETYGKYTYTKVNSEVIIDEYDGTAELLNVPSEIDGCPVRKIADGAMQELPVRALVIPDGIEYIGEWETLYNPNFNYTEFGTIN